MNKLAVSAFLVILLLAVFIGGCAPVLPSPAVSPTYTPRLPLSSFTTPISTATYIPSTTSPLIRAIEKIRSDLELPELPVKFIEKTTMVNSPSGSLVVETYQDSEGRTYSVDPETNRVVEIDARTLSIATSPNPQTFSMDDLKTKALKYIKASIPNFETLQTGLTYEEGAKGDNCFFSWYGDSTNTPGLMNRPFVQIGLYKSGLLFAYYNTLLLK
jgi:hypothetical protein